MIEFLKGQPNRFHNQLLDLLSRGSVQMSVMLHLDFATEPLWLSNRNVPFTDLKWGHTWGLALVFLVSLPEVSNGEGELAPFREYRLGVPDEWIDSQDWAAELVRMTGNKKEYRSRNSGLYGQLFDPETDQPVGYPFAFDIGLMDKMRVKFPGGGAIVSLTVESFLARKGVPSYGMLTYFDQQRRHPTDEGLQNVTEAGKLIVWTNW